MQSSELRAFVVDDSATARALLRRALERDPGVRVVGETASARGAIERVPGSTAQIVLMDVVMPDIDGVSAIATLMEISPRPIVVVSDLVGRDGTLPFRALSAGALDVLRKPSASDLRDEATVTALTRRLRVLAGVPVVRRRVRAQRAEAATIDAPRDAPELIVIGASTGGPNALCTILGALGGPPQCPIVIVQHVSDGFVRGLVSWLREETRQDVRLAEHGARLEAGTILIAPDGRHIAIEGSAIVTSAGPERAGHRPSIDVLFESVARSATARRAMGVLLTGMGRDGAHGLAMLRQRGAWTIAQDRESSVVYGMPRAAAELGAACEVLALGEIAQRVAACASARSART